MAKSNDLCTDLYKSNWHLMTVKQRRIIITFMERLKRPSVILVTHLFMLDLRTFSSVKVEKLRTEHEHFIIESISFYVDYESGLSLVGFDQNRLKFLDGRRKVTQYHEEINYCYNSHCQC